MSKTSTKKRGSRTRKATGPRPCNEPSLSAEIIRLFKDRGCCRSSPSRSAQQDPKKPNHRGYEVRFMARTREELQEILRALKAGNVKHGKPFTKGPHWRIPVYGRGTFLAFQKCAKT